MNKIWVVSSYNPDGVTVNKSFTTRELGLKYIEHIKNELLLQFKEEKAFFRINCLEDTLISVETRDGDYYESVLEEVPIVGNESNLFT